MPAVDQEGLAISLLQLGFVTQNAESGWDSAQPLFNQSLLFRELGDQDGVARVGSAPWATR